MFIDDKELANLKRLADERDAKNGIGKNFSGNSNKERSKSDFYQTPYSLTELLLASEEFLCHPDEVILEPCRGQDAIVKVLKRQGYANIVAYDLTDGVDFLQETRKFHTIITNPPYRLAFEFIKKAKEVSKDFYFLLPLSYLHGQQRYEEIYQDKEFPLRSVGVFTRYPLLEETVREDGKHKTGMQVFAWFNWQKLLFWEKERPEEVLEPHIYWLDNNSYVCRKGE